MRNLNEEIVITTKVITKETSKGVKFNHIITLNGREFKRNSIKKFNYFLAVKGDSGWIVDGYSSQKEGLDSKISYYKKVNGSKAGVVRSFETKVFEINE